MEPISIGAIFSAIVAAIKAIPLIDSWFQMLIAAWMQNQTKTTYTKIIDAAAEAARAVTDEERYKASQKWIEALARPRVLK